MSNFFRIILVMLAISILSAFLFAQENVVNIVTEPTKCSVKLKVKFLKQDGYIRKILPISNSCQDRMELQELAIKEAKNIEFDIKIIKGEITDVIKPVEYSFEIVENKKTELVEIKEQLVILEKPKAAYPKSDGGTVCMRGVVRLKVAFLANGQIGEVAIVSGLPFGANENAIEAAKKMKFLPMKRNGIPVSTNKTVVFNFNIY